MYLPLMTSMTNADLKKAIKALGVTDRMLVRDGSMGKLDVFLSKSVRQNAELMTAIDSLIMTVTGRKPLTGHPGSFPRYSIQPTFEA